MKSYFKTSLILLIIIVFTNCKNEEKLSEYKFSEKEFELNCENVDLKLIKEAVYSFEADINKYYVDNGANKLSQAYNRAVNIGFFGRAKFNKIASEHTQEIFKILKKDTDLWNLEGKTKSLNYDHELVKCISNNLTDKNLQTTFNALLSTNSMSAQLFGEALRRHAFIAVRDKSLATYIALDMYYAKLFDVDFEKEANKKEPAQIKN